MKTIIKIAKSIRSVITQDLYKDNLLIDTWYNIWNYIIVKLSSLERMMYWGYKLRNNYDFDYSSIFEMLQLKLSRMIQSFDNNNNGNSEWIMEKNNKQYKALKLSIKLLDKINQDNYYHVLHKKFESKYGSTITNQEEHENNFIRIWFTHTHLSDDEYRKHMNELNESATRMKNRDIRNLFNIMNNNIQYWWD